MRKKRLILACLLSLPFLLGCRAENKWARIVDQKSNLVVVFKDGATQQEINKAINRRVFVEKRGSYFMPPGVRSLAKIDVRGHDAYAISFNDQATEALRERIRAEMASSPGVLKVFSNIEPAKIEL